MKEKQDKVVAIGTKVLAVQVSRGEAKQARRFMYLPLRIRLIAMAVLVTQRRELILRANPNAKVIAVDPRVIPLGTKVYVEGYGYAIAADTGSAIKGYKIDVFFPSKSDAFRWGSKTRQNQNSKLIHGCRGTFLCIFCFLAYISLRYNKKSVTYLLPGRVIN